MRLSDQHGRQFQVLAYPARAWHERDSHECEFAALLLPAAARLKKSREPYVSEPAEYINIGGVVACVLPKQILRLHRWSEEDVMKDDIVRDNKERYDELNPYLTTKAKIMWVVIAVVIGLAVIAAAVWA
jgi:hypothetical protein